MDMQSMPMPQDSMMSMPGAVPEWALLLFAMFFLGATCFYLYRVVFANQVRAAYGYYDLENELGHLVCMAGMITMLSPSLLPIPSLIWTWVLGTGSVWFFIRACTWGRKLSHNWWWWDLIHVGMLGFMAVMFSGFERPLLTYAACAFWIYFIVYAAVWAFNTRKDGRFGSMFDFGSDLAHICMGVMMLLMTVFPQAFMAGMIMCM
jgi:hypothetical protein